MAAGQTSIPERVPETDRSAQETPAIPARVTLGELDHQESKLWRSALLVLVSLAAALTLVSWGTIRTLPHRLEALPIGLLILVILLGVYLWSKSRELSRLRALVIGIERRNAAPPSEKQLEELFSLIASSQQGYRDLIDTFDDLLFAFSLHGEVRACNRSFAEVLGQPFQEIIGHFLDDFLDDPEGASRTAAEKALPRLLEERHWSGVIRVRLKSAAEKIAPPEWRYFDCVLHAMVKEERVVGFSAMAREVTQQRENEMRFTDLFQTLQEGVYLTTPDGKLLDANPALVRMLGYRNKEELQGVRVTELYFDPSQREAALGELERLGGSAEAREITLRRRDGTPLVCLDTSTAVRDPFGRIVRYQGTLLDVTHRRQMEKRLHGEREFARRLIDSFPDLIAVLDKEGHYTFVSPKITEALGYPPEELLGQRLGERAHPEDRPALLELFHDLTAGKRSHGILEYRTQHRQRGWRLFRASASPLFDEEGKIAGVVASARDVTDIRRLEQQVTQSEKLAAMGQMIAGVAHELNNPLTAILGVSELLCERATDDAMRRQLDLAHRQARRAAHIVQSLLAFSRPPSPGKLRLNLNEIMARTLQLHEHSLRSNRIAVEFTPRPDLPPVLGDANQMMQVFLNLITNAEQAIREVREHGTLRIRLERAGNDVVVTFQNDGPAIPREALPRLFDPFFTTKRPGGGTGLGLSICLAIVREHDGNLEAMSPPGGGAVFTLSLPLADDTAAPAPQNRWAPGAETASLRGVSILVVDDEDGIRELVQESLSARGMLVDCAATGEAAIDLASRRTYDVVLCDINLAGPQGRSTMSGDTVFQQLGERTGASPAGRKPRFIFMTGSLIDPSSRERLTRDGSRVLQKPFQISELVAILGDALAGVDAAGTRQSMSS